MHSRRLHFALAILLLAAFALAVEAQKPADAWAEWETLSPETEEFTVLMPKNPTTESTTFPYHKMEINARLYMATSSAGPVLAITRVAGAAEAIEMANDTDYGLAASLWTRDLQSTLNLIPQIQAGTVWVNSHVPIDPNLPFGGYKQSGIGRDFGPRWLDGYTEEKAVCIAH